MSILFLDDDKKRHRQFRSAMVGTGSHVEYVHTAEECIEKLTAEKDEIWSIVFLDHDLGGETYVDSSRKDCGMEVVRWIIEKQPGIRTIVVHSHNTIAGEEMTRVLIDDDYNASYMPFNKIIDNMERLC